MNTITTKQVTTTQLTLSDAEHDFILEWAPYCDEVVTKFDGDILTVAYLVLDDDSGHMDPLEDDEAVEVVWFANGYERNEWLEENELGERDFLIEKYEHGLVHYSVAATQNYPDRQFDVATGVGVLTLGGDITPTEGHPLDKIANSILSTYSDWCNGSVYGVVCQEFSIATGDEVGEVDACWGFIGLEHAEQERDFYIG